MFVILVNRVVMGVIQLWMIVLLVKELIDRPLLLCVPVSKDISMMELTMIVKNVKVVVLIVKT